MLTPLSPLTSSVRPDEVVCATLPVILPPGAPSCPPAPASTPAPTVVLSEVVRVSAVAPPEVNVPPPRRTSRTLSTITDRDRKSTRLNSSHGYISYAVFCLKKKKNKKTASKDPAA